jgi:2,5-diketo-D-gluconate reductase A
METGGEIPPLAFGTWQIPDGDPVIECVGWALEAGYRHIDTAQRYANETGVGEAIAQSGLPREQVFVTTKFDPMAGDPVEQAERSLERLGVERIDLYLVHWPLDEPLRAWPGMVRAKERGLARSIGVSNFSADELADVCAGTDDPPIVNQVQLSPFEYRRALLEACARLAVMPAAWSPLTRGAELEHPVVGEIARACGRTPAQALLRWGLQRGLIVIPKSANRERIRENAAIFDFSLSAEQMASLDALDRTGGTGRAQERRSVLGRLVARARRG